MMQLNKEFMNRNRREITLLYLLVLKDMVSRKMWYASLTLFFISFFKDLQDPAWLNEFAYDRLLVGLAQEVRSFNISRFLWYVIF